MRFGKQSDEAGTDGNETQGAASTPVPGRKVRGSETGRPIMALLDLLGRRWALRVLWELRDTAAPTFRDLQQRCGGVSSSVLTDRLNELTDAGIVHRGAAGYSLTSDGSELLKAVLLMEEWATGWSRRMKRRRDSGSPRWHTASRLVGVMR